jgi:hypothetical protein
MRAVGDERRAQLAAIGSADLSALANGESMRTMWTAALQLALDADVAYVAWAEPTLTDGCRSTGSRAAAYQRGRTASDRAGGAKNRFLAEWNPVARSVGLIGRSRDDV